MRLQLPCPSVNVPFYIQKMPFCPQNCPELPFNFPELPLYFPDISKVSFCFLELLFCFPEVPFYFSKMPYCFSQLPFGFPKVPYFCLLSGLFPKMLFFFQLIVSTSRPAESYSESLVSTWKFSLTNLYAFLKTFKPIP